MPIPSITCKQNKGKLVSKVRDYISTRLKTCFKILCCLRSHFCCASAANHFFPVFISFLCLVRIFLRTNFNFNQCPGWKHFKMGWWREARCTKEHSLSLGSDTSPQGQQTFVLKMGGGSNDGCILSPEAKGIVSVGASTPCISKMLPCLCVCNLSLESIILLQRISIVCHSTK